MSWSLILTLPIGSMFPQFQPFFPVFAKAGPIHYCTTLSSQAADTTCGFILCMCSDGGIHPIALAFWRLKLLFSSSILVCSRGLHLSDNHTEQRCTTHGRTHITLPTKISFAKGESQQLFWDGSAAIQLYDRKIIAKLHGSFTHGISLNLKHFIADRWMTNCFNNVCHTQKSLKQTLPRPIATDSPLIVPWCQGLSWKPWGLTSLLPHPVKRIFSAFSKKWQNFLWKNSGATKMTGTQGLLVTTSLKKTRTTKFT